MTVEHYFVIHALGILQVDRNLGVYLAQQPVLTSIDANRPEAWFPGPLGPYHAWFPCI